MRRVTSILLILSAALAMTFNPYSAAAQPDRGYRGKGGPMGSMIDNIPGITQEQKGKIEELKVKHMGSTIELRAGIREKQARIETLSVADKPDMKAINATIDEIASMKAELQKKRIAFRMEVRGLLTPEQRVYFDSRMLGRGQGNPMHQRQGNMPGRPGACPNQGNERRPAQ